jgi:hypothetical protein
MIVPCLCCLDGDGPAYPLIAREWSETLPQCESFHVRQESPAEIWWQGVYYTASDSLYSVLGHE